VHRRSWVLAAGLLLTGAACAHHGSGANLTPLTDPVQVEVTNKYGLAMDIYAQGAGVTHRLGLVNPGTFSRFTLPPGMLGGGSVEFKAYPTAQPAQLARSGGIMLAPGDTVDFQITAQLFNSYATVRP
jgi:hypothetical protein